MNDIFIRFFSELEKGNDLPAVWGLESTNFTYRQLAEQIEIYCKAITAAIGDRKNLVAILSTRTSYNAALILAAIKSGKAYLPIDPANPLKRIRHILNDSQPGCLIVENCLLGRISREQNQIAFGDSYKLDGNYTLLICRSESALLDQEVVQVLYTSGSTGFPKAVIHTYHSVGWFVRWCVSRFHTAKGSRILAVAPSSFDLSVFDLFFSLSTGCCLVIPSDRQVANARLMAQLIQDCRINLIYSTPSFFKFLIENGKAVNYKYPDLRHCLLAGEPLFWKLLHDLQKHFIAASFFNLYGPTETNVCCYYEVDFADEKKFGSSVPIGQVCEGLSIDMLPAENGLSQLLISGPSLFSGYLHQDNASDNIQYSTGDLVSMQHEQLVFESRADRMIKRNGYRIEPSEIEQCIKRLPEVTGAIIASAEITGRTSLVAFIETRASYSPLQIKNHCLDHLPRYFLPDQIFFFEEFPLNSNFKPDLTTLLINSY